MLFQDKELFHCTLITDFFTIINRQQVYNAKHSDAVTEIGNS